MSHKKIRILRYVSGALIGVIGILWLLPTLFAGTTKMEITDYQLQGVDESGNYNIYTVTYTYDRNGESASGQYQTTLLQGLTPRIGEQQMMYYIKIWPYTANLGGPPSPVPPMTFIALGFLIAFMPKINLKKLLKKKR